MPITVGGNFDESTADSYPALLDFLREQEFADKLAKVAFKPIIREAKPQAPKGFIPLTAVGAVPWIIPLLDDEESALRAIYERLDGVFLTGGVDVDPDFYREARDAIARSRKS